MMTPQEQIDTAIIESKSFRRELDDVLQRINVSNSVEGEERKIAMVKIQEAIMWLGMDCKWRNDGKSCYEHGYDNTPIVEPTADGVKL